MRVSPQSDIEISTLYPELLLRRKLPVNLEPEDRQLFEDDLEQLIPPSKLLVMHDVYASAEGLLFKAGRILPESFAAPFLLDAWKSKSRLKFLAHNYLFKTGRTLDADAVWIVDDWSGGYYHWLADTLPRLFSIQDRLRDLTLLLPARFRELQFVTASLEAFELGDMEFVAPNEKVLCPRLIVPMHTAPSGHHNEETVRGLRNLMVKFFRDNRAPNSTGRIYISRRKATKRRTVNEEEVLKTVTKFGFQVIDAERLGFAQQVQLSSSARYLISNHGAALTNMMFMQDGSSVLELRHKTDCRYNCYFNLASALNLKYFYELCEVDNPSEDAHTADLRVDVRNLEQTIEGMIGSDNTVRPVY